MRITIIGGGGYVGLITALGFARLGHDVVAVDIKVVFDGRNALDPSTCTGAGLDYHGIGRPHILAAG